MAPNDGRCRACRIELPLDWWDPVCDECQQEDREMRRELYEDYPDDAGGDDDGK